MPPDVPLSLIIKSNSLGTVGNYGSAALAARKVDSLDVAETFLRATLDEMIKMRHLSKILDEDNRELLQETGDRYFELERRMKELQLLESRSWMHRLFKGGAIKRARRTFVSQTFELWNSTSTKSDAMKQNYFVTPTADLPAVESGSVPRDQPISGVVLDLPKGPFTQEAAALVQEVFATLAADDPFADQTPSDSQVGGASSSAASEVAEAGTPPTSPNSRNSASSANTFNINFTVVNNTNSVTSGMAINSTHGNSG